MNLIEHFQESFSNRKITNCLTLSDQLDEDEYAEVMVFSGKSWSDIDVRMLEENFEVINWFSPKAFCYFLPGICCAGVRENRPDLLIYESIVSMLDRSLEPTYWDSFFLERWALLDKSECEAVQEWLLWLSSNNSFYFENSISRAIDTLDLLKQGVTTFR